MLLRPSGSSERRAVDLVWAGDTVSLTHAGRTWRGQAAVADKGQQDAYSGVLRLGEALAADGHSLIGCASCVWFRFSGMSRDMSGGSVGYCGLVGFRDQRGVVDLLHGCGEWQSTPGWPEDDAGAWLARKDLTHREPRPARGNAFAGAVLGLAIGDAMGFATEFRRRGQILEAFGSTGVTDFVARKDPRWPERPFITGRDHPPGTYSDDTQMSVAVARALAAGPREDIEPIMRRMGENFVEWGRSDDNDRSPGNACMTGCDNLGRGVHWSKAGVPGSKGCGSAMRVAPIGMVYWRDRARLLDVARASSLLTHGHDAAVEGSAAAALLVALALEKRSPAQMHKQVLLQCGGLSADFASCWRKLPQMLEREPSEALSRDGLGEGWVAEEAVASALYCFWRSPSDARQTILTAVNTDGDSDSIACIAGSIAGAFNGLEAIPESWRSRVENAAMLFDLASALHAASSAR